MDSKLIFDNHFIPAAWQLIMSSKSTIDLSFYKAELPKKIHRDKLALIYEALFLKKKEGVRIRVLLNKEQPLRGVSRYNVVVASYLKEKNIPCRFLKDSRCCHSKFIVADRSNFYVGSHNLSINAATRNFETGIILSDSVLASEISDRFGYLWDNAAENF